MAIIKPFTIDEIMNIEVKYEPIIDKFLYYGDTKLIKATSKTGKTVLSQQEAHAASSGESLFGAFRVPKAVPVCYISGEGFIGNWKDRFINMQKMWKLNHDNFRFIECTFMNLHKPEGGQELLKLIKTLKLDFKVFVFDPIMFLCVGGSYNNDVDMNTFFSNVEMIKRAYGNAAAIVVHHDSEKEFIAKDGSKHKSANEKTSMGSTSINAVITHSYTLEKYNRGKKVFHKIKLANERASWMVKELDLLMIVPETDDEGRLGYSLDYNDSSTNYSFIKECIRTHKEISDHKLTEKITDELEKAGKDEMSTSTLYYNIGKLRDAKLVDTIKKDGKGYYIWTGE